MAKKKDVVKSIQKYVDAKRKLDLMIDEVEEMDGMMDMMDGDDETVVTSKLFFEIAKKHNAKIGARGEQEYLYMEIEGLVFITRTNCDLREYIASDDIFLKVI